MGKISRVREDKTELWRTIVTRKKKRPTNETEKKRQKINQGKTVSGVKGNFKKRLVSFKRLN